MIGYYIHHHGTGHLRRAASIARRSRHSVVALSSLTSPDDHPFADWVQLPDDPAVDAPVDRTAHGTLHWAPLNSPGYRARMGAIAEWITRCRPALVHVDVSVEVAAFARLLGVPVSVTAMPGLRDDRAHQLAYAMASVIVAPWPADAPPLPHLQPHAERVRYVGAFSRFDGRVRGPAEDDAVLALLGGGGSTAPDDLGAAVQRAGFRPRVVGGRQPWIADPWTELCRARIVVAHAGQNAVAEIAAAARPAVVIPEPRPFGEQLVTAQALAADGLAVVCDRWPRAEQWPELLAAASTLDGQRWHRWNDGNGVDRFADALASA